MTEPPRTASDTATAAATTSGGSAPGTRTPGTAPADPAADFERLRARALALRAEGLSRRALRDRLRVHNNDLLNLLLDGGPPPGPAPPARTRAETRDHARELRLRGWTYDRIQLELGCSRSSISLWVRDLPRPERPDARAQAVLASRKRWEHEHAVRDRERNCTKEAARKEIAGMSDRELLIAGTALYWSEGSKDKPWQRRESVILVNSDPGIVRLYLAWLRLLEVPADRRGFRVMIHASADVGAAEAYWADLAGIDVNCLQRTSIKKHNPRTVRKNVGEHYRGCLVVRVRRGAELYRRIEGWWQGMVDSATDTGQRPSGMV